MHKYLFIILFLYISSCSTTQVHDIPEVLTMEELNQKLLETRIRIEKLEYNEAALGEHNKHWYKFAYRCSQIAIKAGVKSTILTISINNNGNVIKVSSSVESDSLSCYKEELKNIQYPTHEFGLYDIQFILTDMHLWDPPVNK